MSNNGALRSEYVGGDGAGYDRVQRFASASRLPHDTAS
jgi:hypothetical protein